jgi:hypothetical protein
MPKLTSTGVFYGLNAIAFILFFVPIFNGPFLAQVDLEHMRKTFPGIEVAVKAKHFNDCLNKKADSKTHNVTEEEATECRDKNYEITGNNVNSLNLNEFTDGAFSFFEPGKEEEKQRLFASVWHYYTTFYEYSVKYTGYRRYEEDLCNRAKNECILQSVYTVSMKKLTKKTAIDWGKKAQYMRNDQLGFFLDTYDNKLSANDVAAFGGEDANIIFLNSNNEYMLTKFDMQFRTVPINAASSDAPVTNQAAGDLLIRRVDSGNSAYMSVWDAEVYNVSARQEFVFLDKDGTTRKKATFSTLANESTTYQVAQLCTQCKTKQNPATPFMPVDNEGKLQTGDDAPALSPATCKEAASDIMYTNIVNTLWHVVLLAIAFFGHLKKADLPDEWKEVVQYPLYALFLNAGIVNLINVTTVWKCQCVKAWLEWYLTTSIFLFVIGLNFYFWKVILPFLQIVFGACFRGNLFKMCFGTKSSKVSGVPLAYSPLP